MKLVSRSALLMSLALATLAPVSLLAPAPAAAQALKPAVGKPLQQASSAAKAGNIAAASKFVDQARSAATTPAERTKVSQMAAYVYTRGGQYGQAAAELERINAPASQLAPLYYQARQYDKAIAAAKRSGQTTIVAQSYVMQGKPAEAANIYAELVKKEPKNLNHLSNLAGAQFRAGDKDAYLETTQRLVRLDPSPARWSQLLGQLKNSPMPRDSKLGLYHLMRETGTLTAKADIEELAKISLVGGQPGIAQQVVNEAVAAGTLDAKDSMTVRLLDAASKRQQAAMTAAPKQAGKPETAVAAGHAYLGANQYPQAIAAYTTGANGPSVGEAQLFKGIAQLRSGNTSAARASFEAVPEGSLKDMASLWNLYAQSKG